MSYLKRFTIIACCGYSSFALAGWDYSLPASEQAEAPPPSTSTTAAAPAEIKPVPDTTYNSGIRLVQSIATGADPLNTLLAEATNATVGIAQSTIRQYLPTFELSLSFADQNKPVFSALGVVPLYESADKVDTFFNQTSVYHQDNRTTLNFGLGYRRMVSDEHVLLGVNAFYDHEFPYDHGRTSVGFEIRSSVAELNANVYQGVSGWQTGANGIQERALGGYDIEAGVTLPYLPQVKAYGKHFQWNATAGVANLTGNAFSVRGTAYPGITAEMGRNFYDGAGQKNSNFASLQVDVIKLVDATPENQPFFSDKAYQLTSMVEHRYDKVRRENIIQKQTRFAVTASGI